MLLSTVVTVSDVEVQLFSIPVEVQPLWFKHVEIGQASVLLVISTYPLRKDSSLRC